MVRSKSTHGFTLIEVMIVVIIIGIMAAIAIPSYRTWFPRHQLRSAMKDVVCSDGGQGGPAASGWTVRWRKERQRT